MGLQLCGSLVPLPSLPGIIIGLQLCHPHQPLCCYLVLSLYCSCVAPMYPYILICYYHWFAAVWLPYPPTSLPGIIIGLQLSHSHLPLFCYLVLSLECKCAAPMSPYVITWYYLWFADVSLPSAPLLLSYITIGLKLCDSHVPLSCYLV